MKDKRVSREDGIRYNDDEIVNIDEAKRELALKTENALLKKRIEQLEIDLTISKKKEGFRFW